MVYFFKSVSAFRKLWYKSAKYELFPIHLVFQNAFLFLNCDPSDTFLPANTTFFLIRIQIFSANSDRNTIVYNVLSPPITARYIRIAPCTYHGKVAMRMEIYGC